MSLSDLLIDVVEGVVGGTGGASPRGLVAGISALSIASTAAVVWVLASSADPLNQPTWSFGVMVGAILSGGGGLFVSLLHLGRSREWLLGLFSVAVNALAITIPTVWLIAR